MNAHNPDFKPDNIFGVCNALGEDFGFNPLYLRLILMASLLWQPVAVISAYAFAGVLVLASRLLFPTLRSARRRKELAAG